MMVTTIVNLGNVDNRATEVYTLMCTFCLYVAYLSSDFMRVSHCLFTTKWPVSVHICACTSVAALVDDGVHRFAASSSTKMFHTENILGLSIPGVPLLGTDSPLRNKILTRGWAQKE